MISGAMNALFIYKFLKNLTIPFEETEAYKLGIIDSDGNIIRKRSTLQTDEEKRAYTIIHQVVWKLKRLLAQIPFGASKIASYAAALWFLKEDRNMYESAFKRYLRESRHFDSNDFKTQLIESDIKPGYYKLLNNQYDLMDNLIASRGETIEISENHDIILGRLIFEGITESGNAIPVAYDDLAEDAPTNSTGQAVSTDVSLPMQKSCRTHDFMNNAVFKVNPDYFYRCVQGKNRYHRYERYVGTESEGEEIRQYGRKNPKAGIIVQNEKSGEMMFLRRK